MGSHVRAVNYASGTILDLQATSVNTLYGWSIRETGSAAASVRLRAVSTSGQILADIGLTADGSSHEWLGPDGVGFTGDLIGQTVGGAVEGVVYVG